MKKQTLRLNLALNTKLVERYKLALASLRKKLVNGILVKKER
jgi:hypothetical protein